MHFSDESYDVSVERKTSKDFIDSDESISQYSMSIFDPNYDSNKKPQKLTVDPDVVPKYGRTVCDFSPNKDDFKDFLAYKSDQSLIIFNRTSHDSFKAKDCFNQIGFVHEKNIEFYKDEPDYVKSVYAYEGLDDRELTFPAEAYIRLLRKSSSNKKINGEDWWEGVYDSKIGFFPSIFVQPLFESGFQNEIGCIKEDLVDKTENSKMLSSNMSPIIANQNDLKTADGFSPTSFENQKVPQ